MSPSNGTVASATAPAVRPAGGAARLARRRAAAAVLYGAEIAAVLIALAPIVWMVSTSLKPEGQILSAVPHWIPETWTLENFRQVLAKYAFLRWTVNSVVVAVIATGIVVVLDAMAGYALARFAFPGSGVIYSTIISMLLVPIQVTVIPLFVVFAEWRMLDTFQALILPTTANVTGVFLMRQFFLNIPAELEEAARIDGASDLQVFSRVVLPLSRPSMAAVAALTFVSSWNNFLWPLIATSSDRARTLPVGIAQYMGAQAGTSGSAPAFGPPLASAVMATAPALIAFFLLQRYFTQGITMTGIKG
ncbi:MAG TPA: carbohydrate ABC transporter permease [bacterium]|nr:carbohydrate ABC transporter permease [bacterium]